MRALLVTAFGEVGVVVDVPEPQCPPDGVVVDVEATGLCRSDWHAVQGHDPDVTLPHVPGHEWAGRVAAVGERVTGWQVGDRVTAPFVNACGSCAQCLDGDHQVCARQTQAGFDRWGSFAEKVVVAHAAVNLVRLPDGVDAVAAAALGCRFATAYRAVVEVGRVALGEWVAVHGCGGVGLSAVMVARAAGGRVVAVDVSPEALALATSLGAEATVLTAPSDDPLQTGRRVREAAASPGNASGNPLPGNASGRIALSLDAFGSATTCAASIASLAPRGRHVQVGLLPAAVGWPQVPMHLVISGELEVLGSHGMSARSYPGMLGMVESGRLRPAELVRRTIRLDEAPGALQALGEPGQGAGVTVVLP